MPQLHETRYGQRFFEQQLPDLISAIVRLAIALEAPVPIKPDENAQRFKAKLALVEDLIRGNHPDTRATVEKIRGVVQCDQCGTLELTGEHWDTCPNRGRNG